MRIETGYGAIAAAVLAAALGCSDHGALEGSMDAGSGDGAASGGTAGAGGAGGGSGAGGAMGGAGGTAGTGGTAGGTGSDGGSPDGSLDASSDGDRGDVSTGDAGDGGKSFEDGPPLLVAPRGADGGLVGHSTRLSLSRDGRWLVFASDAETVVEGDTNGASDVFLHDRWTDTITRLQPDGMQTSADSTEPVLTPDGRYITFQSSAPEWLPADAGVGAGSRIFVLDRDADENGIFDESGQTSLTHVSVTSSGLSPDGNSGGPNPSDDARHVAFYSGAMLTEADGASSDLQLYAHDRDTDEDGVFDEPGAIATTVVSVSSDGVPSDSNLNFLGIGGNALSGDGRHVVMFSFGSNLVQDDTNGAYDVFVHDRDTDDDGVFDEPGNVRTTRVSLTDEGLESAGASLGQASMSRDGRYVAFSFDAPLVAGAVAGTGDVYVVDRDPDGDGEFDEPGPPAITRITTHRRGDGGADARVVCTGIVCGSDPQISAEGRFVVFESSESGLVAGDTNGLTDVFVHDRDMDGNEVFDEPGNVVTHRVSVTDEGVEGDAFSANPVISGNGRIVAYETQATTLAPGLVGGVTQIVSRHRPGL